MATIPENRLCSLCGSQKSTMYCSCTAERSFLCDSCFIPHRNKNPFLIHSTATVEVADFSQYYQRCTAFTQGKEELLMNLTLIDQCCAEFSFVVNALITSIQHYQEEFLGQMQAWKTEFAREIQESLTETEASLVQEEVTLKGRYSSALRHYREENFALFSYTVDASAVNSCLQTLVTTHFSQPEPTELYWVSESSIQWFDVCASQLYPQVELSSQVRVSRSSSWAVVDKKTVVLCGGTALPFDPFSEVWKSAYLLSKSGKVQTLPDMNFGHGSPGLVVWNGKVLVFGSHSKPAEKECEGLRLTASVWEILSPMHKQRCTFTATVWQEAVYLCGGPFNTTIEKFDGFSMQLLELSLLEGTASMACVKGNTLLIFTNGYLVTLSKSENNSLSVIAQKRQGQGANPWTPPLFWNDVVYSFGISTDSDAEKVFMYSALIGNSLE